MKITYDIEGEENHITLHTDRLPEKGKRVFIPPWLVGQKWPGYMTSSLAPTFFVKSVAETEEGATVTVFR